MQVVEPLNHASRQGRFQTHDQFALAGIDIVGHGDGLVQRLVGRDNASRAESLGAAVPVHWQGHFHGIAIVAAHHHHQNRGILQRQAIFIDGTHQHRQVDAYCITGRNGEFRDNILFGFQAIQMEGKGDGLLGPTVVLDNGPGAEAVALYDKTRQHRPDEQRLGHEQILANIGNGGVLVRGNDLGAPGGEVVGHGDADFGLTFGIGGQFGRPVGDIAEVAAHGEFGAFLHAAATAATAQRQDPWLFPPDPAKWPANRR